MNKNLLNYGPAATLQVFWPLCNTFAAIRWSGRWEPGPQASGLFPCMPFLLPCTQLKENIEAYNTFRCVVCVRSGRVDELAGGGQPHGPHKEGRRYRTQRSYTPKGTYCFVYYLVLMKQPRNIAF